jgi:hypothetical protein
MVTNGKVGASHKARARGGLHEPTRPVLLTVLLLDFL